jgi:hypothetical protein
MSPDFSKLARYSLMTESLKPKRKMLRKMALKKPEGDLWTIAGLSLC